MFFAALVYRQMLMIRISTFDLEMSLSYSQFNSQAIIMCYKCVRISVPSVEVYARIVDMRNTITN